MLKRPIMMFLAATAITLLMPVGAQAGYAESHIYTNNETQHVYVWVTARSGKQGDHVVGAWCVNPKTFDKHGVKADVSIVEFAYMKSPGCAAPSWQSGQRYPFGNPRNYSDTRTFTIRNNDRGIFVQ